MRTYTGKPYKLSTPIIRFANGNLVNRNVSSSVVETPACTDQTLPCSQLITLFFRGCTGLEGALTVETTPVSPYFLKNIFINFLFRFDLLPSDQPVHLSTKKFISI